MTTAATGEKRCKVCGTDVSRTKRVKDAAGHYYCAPHAPTSGDAAVTAVSSPAPCPERLCVNCGSAFGALEQGIEFNGHRVCTRCVEKLRAEEQARQDAEADAAAEHAEQATQREQAAATLARAKRRRFDLLGGTIIFGFLTLVVLSGPLVARTQGSDGEPTSTGAKIAWLCLVALLAAGTWRSWHKLRQINRLISDGDAAAIRRIPTDGAPAAVVRPFAIAGVLLVIGIFTLMGLGLGGLADDAVHGKDSGSRALMWIGGSVGFMLGSLIAAAMWDGLRASFCPNCRRYFVATVLTSEQVGSETRTYQRRERLYTKAADGTILATTDVPVQQQETVETHRVHCRCRSCEHEWTALRSWTRR